LKKYWAEINTIKNNDTSINLPKINLEKMKNAESNLLLSKFFRVIKISCLTFWIKGKIQSFSLGEIWSLRKTNLVRRRKTRNFEGFDRFEYREYNTFGYQ